LAVDLVEGQKERCLVLSRQTSGLLLKLKSLADSRLPENDHGALLEQIAPGQTSITAHEEPFSVVEVLFRRFARVPEYREGTIERNFQFHYGPTLRSLLVRKVFKPPNIDTQLQSCCRI
jgi:hypothetical protein